jgi:hypothetical protein
MRLWKHTETSMRQSSQKGNICMMRQWQHWPVSSQDATPSENMPEHRPSAMSIQENGNDKLTKI